MSAGWMMFLHKDWCIDYEGFHATKCRRHATVLQAVTLTLSYDKIT